MERAIVECVRTGDDYPDVMVAKTGIPIEKIIVAVTRLEIRGVLRQQPGGYFTLS